MMKMSILYSLFAVCSLAFCQCDKDGGSASGGNLPFELSVSQWNVPSQGATEEVDLQAPGEWKVKTDYRRRRAVALCQQDVRRRRAAQADAFGRQ